MFENDVDVRQPTITVRDDHLILQRLKNYVRNES